VIYSIIHDPAFSLSSPLKFFLHLLEDAVATFLLLLLLLLLLVGDPPARKSGWASSCVVVERRGVLQRCDVFRRERGDGGLLLLTDSR